MKKPTKPTKKSKTKILVENILTDWDGLTVRELIVVLSDCLLECENAEFKTEWNYESTDCIISGTETDYEFNDRVKKYEADMIKWRKYRINQLQAELSEIKGEVG